MNCPMLCAIAAHPSWWLLLAELLGEPFDRRSFDNPLSICSTLYKPTSEACLAVRVVLGAPAWSYLATTSSTVCNRVLALYAIVAHSSQQGDAKCSRSRHIVQSNGAPFLHGHSIVEMSCFLNFPYSGLQPPYLIPLKVSVSSQKQNDVRRTCRVFAIRAKSPSDSVVDWLDLGTGGLMPRHRKRET
jgi:hypothetical protein